MTLGSEIRIRREARNLTRERLGELMGNIHRDTIGAWELNKAVPNASNRTILGRVLGITSEEFERFLRSEQQSPAPRDTKLRIATFSDALSWGWDASTLQQHLIDLDYDTISSPPLLPEAEGTLEQWTPVFAEHPDTWRMLIDGPRNIVGYWHFALLPDDLYAKAQGGELLDEEITLDRIPFVGLPGRYNLYFVIITIRQAYRGVGTFRMLFDSLIERLVEFAKIGIYIDEICTNAYTLAGKALCETLGMTLLCKHKLGGDVYVLSMNSIGNNQTLKHYKGLIDAYSRQTSRS